MGCRRAAPASELVRLTRASDGTLLIGRTLPGRGAWLCRRSPSCIVTAVRRGALPRALRAPLAPRAAEQLADLVARWEESAEDVRE